MSTKNIPTVAVITGDIINSRAKKDSKDWLEPLKKALATLGESPRQWQIYRGDSFQLRLDKPEFALDIAVWLKAVVRSTKGLDVRMAIGIGDMTHKADSILESNGSAFVNSGDLFDSLKKRTLAIKTPWDEVDELLNLNLKLALLTMDGWSVTVAEVVRASMQMPNATQTEIAEMLGVTQSRVSERQNRSGFDAIMEMLAYSQKLIKQHL